MIIVYRRMEFLAHLNRFSEFSRRKWPSGIECFETGPDLLCVKPGHSRISKRRPRLGILGLIHGNEVAGLSVINEFLEQILKGDLKLETELLVGLGNRPAALANQRFLQKDLNRCFGLNDSTLWEEQRAREIEKSMLDHCDFLIDLHQTNHPTKSPFYIFQYTSGRCLSFMNLINEKVPVILQFDQIGDQSGLTTDEYIRSRGGFGTTLELGAFGFSSEQTQLGLQACRSAVSLMRSMDPILEKTESGLWRVAYPLLRMEGRHRIEENGTGLHPGWENLSPVKRGQIVGTSPKGLIHSEHSGLMLFPKYTGSLEAGQSLYHICRPVEAREIESIADPAVRSLSL